MLQRKKPDEIEFDSYTQESLSDEKPESLAYYSPDNRVIDYKAQNDYHNSLKVFSLKAPPKEDEPLERIEAKLFFLVRDLKNRSDNIFTEAQQKKLLDQLTMLCPPGSNLFLKSKDPELHKRTLIQLYHVIEKPFENFNTFKKDIEQRKKQAGSDRVIGILSYIIGTIGLMVGSFFVIPTVGATTPAIIGGGALMTYGIYKVDKSRNGRRLGAIEETIENGMKNNK